MLNSVLLVYSLNDSDHVESLISESIGLNVLHGIPGRQLSGVFSQHELGSSLDLALFLSSQVRILTEFRVHALMSRETSLASLDEAPFMSFRGSYFHLFREKMWHKEKM